MAHNDNTDRDNDITNTATGTFDGIQCGDIEGDITINGPIPGGLSVGNVSGHVTFNRRR